MNPWLDRIRREWPAALAVAVLVVGHLILLIAGEDTASPLGLPLFAAIVVFLAAEIFRRYL